MYDAWLLTFTIESVLLSAQALACSSMRKAAGTCLPMSASKSCQSMGLGLIYLVSFISDAHMRILPHNVHQAEAQPVEPSSWSLVGMDADRPLAGAALEAFWRGISKWDLVTLNANTSLTGWNPNTTIPFCQWTGMNCSSEGFLQELDLAGLNLPGESDPLMVQRLDYADCWPAQRRSCIGLASCCQKLCLWSSTGSAPSFGIEMRHSARCG